MKKVVFTALALMLMLTVSAQVRPVYEVTKPSNTNTQSFAYLMAKLGLYIPSGNRPVDTSHIHKPALYYQVDPVTHLGTLGVIDSACNCFIPYAKASGSANFIAFDGTQVGNLVAANSNFLATYNPATNKISFMPGFVQYNPANSRFEATSGNWFWAGSLEAGSLKLNGGINARANSNYINELHVLNKLYASNLPGEGGFTPSDYFLGLRSGDSVVSKVNIAEITRYAGSDTSVVNNYVNKTKYTSDSTSAATLIAGKENFANKGIANGYAGLDGGGKVPLSQLPANLLQYMGQWNPTTNTPTLVNGTGTTGNVYEASTSGSHDFGAGSISFQQGDFVIYNGTTWELSAGVDRVTSVNGQQGLVILNTDKVSEGSTNQYFTTARALAATSGTYVNLTGDQSIPGVKTFTNGLNVYGGNLTAGSIITQNGSNVGIFNGVNQFGAINVQNDLSATPYFQASGNYRIITNYGTTPGTPSGSTQTFTFNNNSITRSSDAKLVLWQGDNVSNLVNDAGYVTTSGITTTVAGLRTIINPQSSVYQTTDYGGGQWYWNSTDTRTDNTGTILQVTGFSTGRFNRIYAGNTIYASWFGAKADGVTDDFQALQNAINFLNGNGTVILPIGIIYLNYANGGGLKLPTNATGLTISGDNQFTTILKASINVPRAFDLVGVNSTSTNTYQNITIKNIGFNENNIQSSSYGSQVTSSTTVTAGTTGNYTVTVGSTAGFASSGIIFFSAANTGLKNTWRQFTVLNSTQISVLLNATENITSGDLLAPACVNHVFFGSNGDNYTTVNNYNINYANITIEHINIFNVPTEIGQSFTNVATGKRIGIDINTRTAPGYTGILTIKNIFVKDVTINGGANGIGIYSSTFPNASNVYFSKISIKDCYHNTLITPTTNWGGFNYLLVNSGWGSDILVENCKGYGSSDVGIESDGSDNILVKDTYIANAFGSGFFSTNYNYPASSSGPFSTTLNGNQGSGSTTFVLTAVPTTVPTSGWATIGGTELVYYTLRYNSNTMTVQRGLNGFTPIAHNTGETIIFFDANRQLVKYENCRYENTLLGAGAGPGWFQLRNTIFPVPNIAINNCFYLRKTTQLGYNGEAIALRGHRQSLLINNFSGTVDGIYHTTDDGAVASSINIIDLDGVTGGAMPPMIEKLRNIDLKVSGTLDNGSISKAQYQSIVWLNGNHFIDAKGIAINSNFLNTSGAQTFGLHLGYQTNSISGNISDFKFVSTGDPVPIGIYTTGTTTIGKLTIDNPDFLQMNFGANSANSNYRPWLFYNSANIFVNNARHATGSTLPSAGRAQHSVNVTSATYSASFDDGVIFVNYAGAVAITLPQVTTSSGAQPNTGAALTIIDISGATSTNHITINAASGENISGSSTNVIVTNYGQVQLTAYLTGWVAK
jgi:hypothetical protein